MRISIFAFTLTLFVMFQGPAVYAEEKENSSAVVYDSHLKKLNTLARLCYKHSKERDIASADPVLIIGDDKIIFKHAGKTEEKQYVPPEYHVLKTFSHLPLGIFAELKDQGGKELTAEQQEHLSQMLSEARAALETELSGYRLGSLSLGRFKYIVDMSQNYVDEILKAGSVNKAKLTNYCRQMATLVLANAQVAASWELSALDLEIQQIKATLAPGEWESMHIVITGGHMPRQGETSMQYFLQLTNEKREGRRVIYAESMSGVPPALDLLGTHLLDNNIAVAFFNDYWRMHRDLLSAAAGSYLRKNPPLTGKFPPDEGTR